ncbi:hypothetical protein [Haloplanus halobius]|uniref:hypothetical protein n=1 Tax=Haloplanus halobius TaxID=2934938 RepID=UPI00200C4ED2|nr:hypothetical protein [Haloplanus sp. XH21]
MDVPDLPDRVVLLLIGMLVLLSPALLLVVTFVFLAYTGDVVLGRMTVLELAELYLIDLLVLAGFGYGLYRLVRRLVVHRMPERSAAPEDESVTDGIDRD